MDFLKNIVVNLTATGMAALMITWLICFTILIMFSNGPYTSSGIAVMSTVGMMLALAQSPRD
jgi:hypothetical protein